MKSDSALATKLRNQLTEAHFEELTVHDPSDMSCFLAARSEAGTHEVVWSIESEAQLPGAVRAVYEELVSSGQSTNK